jgi:hypothetical protein
MGQRSELHTAIRRHVSLTFGIIAGILDTAVIVLAFLVLVGS